MSAQKCLLYMYSLIIPTIINNISNLIIVDLNIQCTVISYDSSNNISTSIIFSASTIISNDNTTHNILIYLQNNISSYYSNILILTYQNSINKLNYASQIDQNNIYLFAICWLFNPDFFFYSTIYKHG